MRTAASSVAARAADAVRIPPARVRALLRSIGLWPGGHDDPSRVRAASQLRELASIGPPSLSALADYTRAGQWVPGERNRALEAVGKAYGYLLALPATALLYGLSLVIQRPTRLGLAAFVLTVVWLTT